MELDFTKLNKLSYNNSQKKTAEKPTETPTEPILKQDNKKPTIEETALQGQLDGLQEMLILQKKADANKEETERAIKIYKEYQENIKLSGHLQEEIIKGVGLGEDIYSLFLKAVQAISLMTSNTVFYSQLQKDIVAIYGVGLLEPKPLELELGEVQERLTHLREASQRETEKGDSLQRIKKAIQAHTQRETQLKEMIEKSGKSLTA